MEDHGRSWKVMEGLGRSFPDTRLAFPVRKVKGGGGVVSCRIIVSPQSQSLVIGFSLQAGCGRLSRPPNLKFSFEHDCQNETRVSLI